MECYLDSVTVTAAYPGGSVDMDLQPVDGDSLTIRQFQKEGCCKLLGIYFQSDDTGGNITILAPSLHDNFEGIFLPDISIFMQGANLLSFNMVQQFQSGERMRIIFNGILAQSPCVTLVFYYEGLLNAKSPHLIDYQEYESRMKNIHIYDVAIGVAYPAFAVSGLLPAQDPNFFKQNKEYALIGCLNPAIMLGALNQYGINRIYSKETGGFRIAYPVTYPVFQESQSYFYLLSKRTGLKTIPVFNGINMPTVTIDSLVQIGGEALHYFAELS